MQRCGGSIRKSRLTQTQRRPSNVKACKTGIGNSHSDRAIGHPCFIVKSRWERSRNNFDTLNKHRAMVMDALRWMGSSPISSDAVTYRG